MRFSVKIKGLKDLQKELKEVPRDAAKIIEDEMQAFGASVVADAKRLAPADEGLLRNSISAHVDKLSVTVVAAVDYAPFIEFGTKKFAERHVASLPSEWKTFAATYKGSKGGSFEEMVKRITEWVRRKGIAGTYSVKTRRRTGNRSRQQTENKQAAYAIALSILRNGIRPHPFMYPAFVKNEKKFIDNLRKSLGAK